jgi:hypothetical protein
MGYLLSLMDGREMDGELSEKNQVFGTNRTRRAKELGFQL